MEKLVARISLALVMFVLGVSYGFSTLAEPGYPAPTSMAAAGTASR